MRRNRLCCWASFRAAKLLGGFASGSQTAPSIPQIPLACAPAARVSAAQSAILACVSRSGPTRSGACPLLSSSRFTGGEAPQQGRRGEGGSREHGAPHAKQAADGPPGVWMVSLLSSHFSKLSTALRLARPAHPQESLDGQRASRDKIIRDTATCNEKRSELRTAMQKKLQEIEKSLRCTSASWLHCETSVHRRFLLMPCCRRHSLSRKFSQTAAAPRHQPPVLAGPSTGRTAPRSWRSAL